jgi:hypothetical protein
MIYTIFLSTYTLPAYVVIHPIVIKSHVIKRRFFLATYHGTITTRKGAELYNKLLTAFQEAGIHHKDYEIRVVPPLEPPENDNSHGAAPRVKCSMPS